MQWRGNRFAMATLIMVFVLAIAGLKLVYLQAFQAQALAARAERQRSTIIRIPAQRGAIVDRTGDKLAFSVETRTLEVNLKAMRATWAKAAAHDPRKTYDAHVRQIAGYMAQKLPGKTNVNDLLAKFNKRANFTYLVNGVEPGVADDITKKFPDIAEETRSQREYPAGPAASNIVGLANWRMDDPDVSKHNLHGLIGVESAYDDYLAGKPGQEVADTGAGDDIAIPGTERDKTAAVAGDNLELTVDSDVQYEVQKDLAEYVKRSGAKGGSAVVLDAHTGEVYALADNSSFDPMDFNKSTPAERNNAAITTPYEPGSVNKIVTALSSIQNGITKPNSWNQVPGQITIADRTVHDAWVHGTVRMSTAGIFGKSSNVGTLELAKKLGPDRWMDTAKRLGLGQRTGLGLPGESAGWLPPRNTWSGTTFGNLPIGQGVSMTVVQMASMYQALANDGVRVPPRIVKSIDKGNTKKPTVRPRPTRVVSVKTARTVRDMLRGVVQKGPAFNSGTAPTAALSGYQISGKTGTAQQIDSKTGKYSMSKYNITFAGILPADKPRFVVGIMLDAPDTTSPIGHSAGTLFHEIAGYLAQRYEIPLSKTKAPYIPLQATSN